MSSLKNIEYKFIEKIANSNALKISLSYKEISTSKLFFVEFSGNIEPSQDRHFHDKQLAISLLQKSLDHCYSVSLHKDLEEISINRILGGGTVSIPELIKHSVEVDYFNRCLLQLLALSDFPEPMEYLKSSVVFITNEINIDQKFERKVVNSLTLGEYIDSKLPFLRGSIFSKKCNHSSNNKVELIINS